MVFGKGLITHDFAAEHQSVADREPLDEIFLDFAEHAAAPRDRAGRPSTAGARTHQAHLEHRLFDDGADIEAIALTDFRGGDAPTTVFILFDAGEALVGFQRIAAGRDEIDYAVEVDAAQFRIRRGGADLVI